jgi:hypothetical protein
MITLFDLPLHHFDLNIFQKAPPIIAELAGDGDDEGSDEDEGDGMSTAVGGDEDEVYDEAVVDMAVDTLAERVHRSHVGLAGDGDPRTYVGLLTKNVIYRRLLACNMHCTVSPLLLFINRIWSF